MAALPIVLTYGYVAIYGAGLAMGVQNFPAAAGWKFGTVTDEAPDIYGLIGKSVMFKETEVRCRISYNNYPYTITAKALLAFTENPPV